MLAKEISSLQHPIVKQFVKLRDSRKERYAQKSVPIMGIKQIKEASAIDVLFISRPCKTDRKADKCYLVTPEILKKMTGQPNPEPLAALVPMPSPVDLKNKERLIALDNVSDPGNVGTLLRTALGIGFDGAFLTQTCADPFNGKALRSAMGATFRLPLQMGTASDLIELAYAFTPLVAAIKGAPLSQLQPISKPLLILGSEAQGVSPIFKEKFPALSIPTLSIESLNVAAAGAILMYHFAHER